MGRFQTHQREASLNLVGAIIPPWRGVPDVTSVDRKSRSLDRFTGNSPCSRRAILGWPSQPTRAIRAGPRTPVRARPSAKRPRSIRCDRLTRRRPVRIRRKWISEAPRLAGQGKRRWIMRLLSRARLLLALSLLTSVASACAECAWVFWEESTGPPLHESSTRAVSAWNTREACEQALTQKFGSDSDLYSKNTNTEVVVDHQAGQPRLWARTKGHPELLIMNTYVCPPDTVHPRGPRTE